MAQKITVAELEELLAIARRKGAFDGNGNLKIVDSDDDNAILVARQ